MKIALTEDKSKLSDVSDANPLYLPAQARSILSKPRHSPPKWADFLTLPDSSARPSAWGVYMICMQHPTTHDQKMYAGSGTDSRQGLKHRMDSYTSKSGPSLPRHVGIAIDRGYVIIHVGIVCAIDLPAVGLRPRARAFMKGAEAYSGLIFHCVFPAITDSWTKHLLLWARDDIDWSPLCGHSALSEGVRGDLELTPEELEAADATRAARYRVYDLAYHKSYRKQAHVHEQRMDYQKDWRSRPEYHEQHRPAHIARAAAK